MKSTDIVLKAKEYVEKLYAESVPEYYCYHSIEHTRRVVRIAEEIGTACELNDSELEALLLAAWFHDAGFSIRYLANEPEGAKLAESCLAEWGYPTDKIALIKRLILATELTYKPKTLLEKIIRDADLIHLGQTDFNEINNQLRREWKLVIDKEMSEEAWQKLSLDFQNLHTFNTKYARKKYGPTKRENIEKLKALAEKV